MSLREFLGFFNKTTYTREEFLKAFYECLEEHNVNRDNLPPLVEPEILVSYEAWLKVKVSFTLMNTYTKTMN